MILRAKPNRAAVIIPAVNEAARIASTVRAARAIPGVDLVLVVDDGSEDDTQDKAREAGAVVVRHSHNRGKSAALETGAAVVGMRDLPGDTPRSLLLLDADLGESAVACAPLVPPVLAGTADATIATLPVPVAPAAASRAARKAIRDLCGVTFRQPLVGLRCVSRAAFELAVPLARGWGLEAGMTIDLLQHGMVVQEVEVNVQHERRGGTWAGGLHRAAQVRDVMVAVQARRLRALASRLTGGRAGSGRDGSGRDGSGRDDARAADT